MDIKAAVKQLLSRGWSEIKLADELGCNQSTINRIANGQIKQPRYDIGAGIMSLASSRREPPRKGE